MTRYLRLSFNHICDEANAINRAHKEHKDRGIEVSECEKRMMWKLYYAYRSFVRSKMLYIRHTHTVEPAYVCVSWCRTTMSVWRIHGMKGTKNKKRKTQMLFWGYLMGWLLLLPLLLLPLLFTATKHSRTDGDDDGDGGRGGGVRFYQRKQIQWNYLIYYHCNQFVGNSFYMNLPWGMNACEALFFSAFFSPFSPYFLINFSCNESILVRGRFSGVLRGI